MGLCNYFFLFRLIFNKKRRVATFFGVKAEKC